MRTVTQKEALDGLRVFSEQNPDALPYMVVTDCDGLVGHYSGITTDFKGIKTSEFRITDSNIVQLDRWRKAQPSYDHYHALIQAFSNGTYGIRHEAVDWTQNRGQSVHDEMLYYTADGELVKDMVGA